MLPFTSERKPPPSFSGATSDRLRVVVENADLAEGAIEQRILEQAGCEVVLCEGPIGSGGTRCPLLTDESCPAIDDADAVISSLRMDDPSGAEVIDRLRDCTTLKLVVAASPASADRHDARVRGVDVVYPLTAHKLRGLVADLAGQQAT